MLLHGERIKRVLSEDLDEHSLLLYINDHVQLGLYGLDCLITTLLVL